MHQITNHPPKNNHPLITFPPSNGFSFLANTFLTLYTPYSSFGFVGKLKHGNLDSAVGISTRYGPGGPGIKSRLGRDFQQSSRPDPRPIQSPLQKLTRLYRRKEARAWCAGLRKGRSSTFAACLCLPQHVMCWPLVGFDYNTSLFCILYAWS